MSPYALKYGRFGTGSALTHAYQELSGANSAAAGRPVFQGRFWLATNLTVERYGSDTLLAPAIQDPACVRVPFRPGARTIG